MHLHIFLLEHQFYLCFKFNYIYFGVTISYLFYFIESISETTYTISL